MSKKLISARIPPSVLKKLGDNIATNLAESIRSMDFKCPVCGQPWPRKEPNKEKIVFRLDEELVDRIKVLDNSSHFISIAAQVACGHCPVCQRQRNK